MKEIRVSPKFVNTRNVRNFQAMMDALEISAGEGRLAVVIGQAGRGKTRTAQVYAAHNRCAFLRCLSIWRTSELDFLRGLCRELGVKVPPNRKDAAFRAVLDTLMHQGGSPVFIEEIEKLPKLHLELVRDLSDLSSAAFVLIGEEELQGHVDQVRRMWNRTSQLLEFKPLGVGDIIMYAKEAAELELPPDVAALLHTSSAGNFRVVKRDLHNLANMMNANGTLEPTLGLVKIAIKQSLQG